MPDRAELSRRYRRLLWTYPRSYRRVHGDEIVTTLLDAAPADRVRPTRFETRDLLLGGLRHRLRVRGGAAVLTVLCALFGAVAGGALGGYAGWQTAPDLPSDAAAARLLVPLLPAGSGADVQRWDFLFDDNPAFTARWEYWIGGTDEYEYGRVFVDVPESDAQHAADPTRFTAARARLVAAGWRPAGAAASADHLIAYRDGWRAEVRSEYVVGSEDSVLRFAVTRTTPAAVLPLAVVGVLFGGLMTWLMTAAGARRLAAAPARRGPAAGLLVAALFLLLPSTALSAVLLVVGALDGPEPTPLWGGYTFLFARGPAWLGLLSLLSTAAIAAVPPPRDASVTMVA